MQLKKLNYLAAALLVMTSSALADSNTITYKNTKGSLLNLQINADNTLSGSFTTAVASKDCPQAIGMKRPLVGYIVKNALTFSVSYPGCGVITLIGNISDNQKTIDTLGLIVHPTIDINKAGPGAWMISHDVFTQE